MRLVANCSHVLQLITRSHTATAPGAGSAALACVSAAPASPPSRPEGVSAMEDHLCLLRAALRCQMCGRERRN